MKRIKIGFAAIIAIAATSFTVVSASQSAKLVSGCYTQVTVNGSTYTGFRTPGQNHVEIPANQQPTGTQFQNSVDSDDCLGTDAFCCYEVVDNKIVGVYFQP